jgi:hypothetical protein
MVFPQRSTTFPRRSLPAVWPVGRAVVKKASQRRAVKSYIAARPMPSRLTVFSTGELHAIIFTMDLAATVEPLTPEAEALLQEFVAELQAFVSCRREVPPPYLFNSTQKATTTQRKSRTYAALRHQYFQCCDFVFHWNKGYMKWFLLLLLVIAPLRVANAP